MSKSLEEERTQYVFQQELSEIDFVPRTEEEIEKSLFKTFNPEQLVDAYEKSMGLEKPSAEQPKLRYKHIMLSPGVDDEDSQLLDTLMNDPELYQIVNRTQTWTVRGEFKIFIEYTENLDVKKKREKRIKRQQQRGSEDEQTS